MRAGPRPARIVVSEGPPPRLAARLLRDRALVAARSSRRRDDLHAAAARRRLLHIRVEVGRRTDHAIRIGELVAQVLVRAAAADRSTAAARRTWRLRGAVRIARAGLGGLGSRHAGPEQDETC